MSLNIRAILVSVDYSDLLALTLPWNRHHFEDVMVVTSTTDGKTADVALANGSKVFMTNAFYDRGASFNKWAALEKGLDAFGRYGWLAIMDADVLWPKVVPAFNTRVGCLYTPMRRMMREPNTALMFNEQAWKVYPLHRQQREWAGYTQVFHADDPVLPPAPWHEVDWRHAGGADSFFQARWTAKYKLRPGFECLHIGESGVNWFGRSTPYVDGSGVPAESAERRAACMAIWPKRRAAQAGHQFDSEKLN